jgi:hypothetical protein
MGLRSVPNTLLPGYSEAALISLIGLIETRNRQYYRTRLPRFQFLWQCPWHSEGWKAGPGTIYHPLSFWTNGVVSLKYIRIVQCPENLKEVNDLVWLVHLRRWASCTLWKSISVYDVSGSTYFLHCRHDKFVHFPRYTRRRLIWVRL